MVEADSRQANKKPATISCSRLINFISYNAS